MDILTNETIHSLANKIIDSPALLLVVAVILFVMLVAHVFVKPIQNAIDMKIKRRFDNEDEQNQNIKRDTDELWGSLTQLNHNFSPEVVDDFYDKTRNLKSRYDQEDIERNQDLREMFIVSDGLANTLRHMNESRGLYRLGIKLRDIDQTQSFYVHTSLRGAIQVSQAYNYLETLLGTLRRTTYTSKHSVVTGGEARRDRNSQSWLGLPRYASVTIVILTLSFVVGVVYYSASMSHRESVITRVDQSSSSASSTEKSSAHHKDLSDEGKGKTDSGSSDHLEKLIDTTSSVRDKYHITWVKVSSQEFCIKSSECWISKSELTVGQITTYLKRKYKRRFNSEIRAILKDRYASKSYLWIYYKSNQSRHLKNLPFSVLGKYSSQILKSFLADHQFEFMSERQYSRLYQWYLKRMRLKYRDYEANHCQYAFTKECKSNKRLAQLKNRALRRLHTHREIFPNPTCTTSHDIFCDLVGNVRELTREPNGSYRSCGGSSMSSWSAIKSKLCKDEGSMLSHWIGYRLISYKLPS